LGPLSALPALVAAQAAGIVLADAGALPAAFAAAGAAHASAVALVAAGRRHLRAAAALGLALCAGALAHAVRLEPALRFAPWAPVEVTLEARLAALESTRAGWIAELRDVAATEPGAPALPPAVRLYGVREGAVADGGFAERLPGSHVRLRARLRPPSGRSNPGGRDPARALLRAGVGAVGSLVHPALHALRTPPAPPRAALERMRRGATARLARRGPGGALLAELALGARGSIPDADEEALARLGLTHLLSVSGLHLALVAGGAFAAARAAAARSAALAARVDARRAGLGGAVAAAALYAAATGFAVPVQRSLVIVLALALAALRRRPQPRGHALVLAAGAVLALEPSALFAPGAQLSFAATAALVFARRAPGPSEPARGVRRAARALAAALDASACAVAVTAPIVAFHFGRSSPVGWLANALAVPLTGVFLLPLALAAGAVAAFAPEAPAVEAVLDAAARAAEALLALAAAGAAPVPAAQGVAASGAVYALAAVLGAVVLRATHTSARVVGAVAGSALLAAAPPARIAPPPPRIVALDVGQGDAVLVQGRTGALLIDAGTLVPDGPDLGARVVVPALRALGVRRLDLVAASHADLDHRGGLPAVLASLPVARLWLPHGGLADPAFAALVAAARDAGAAVEERGLGSAPLQVGDLRVEALWPPAAPEPAASRNARSLTLRVEAAGRAVLLPGDLEAAGEARLVEAGVPLRADVLKLAHHGSRTSSTRAFLAAVGGRVAIASAPRMGRFGMPHRDAVARARAAGYALWWTGRDGAVLVGLGPELEVRGWRR
jgi:competence protein ComEC